MSNPASVSVNTNAGVIVKSVKNEQSRLFIFTGRASRFPLDETRKEKFYEQKIVDAFPDAKLQSGYDAFQKGYEVVKDLFRNEKIDSVMATVEKDKDGNLYDAVLVTLNDKHKWTGSDRTLAGQTVVSINQKTNEAAILEFLSKAFAGRPLYINQSDLLSSEAVLNKINKFFNDNMNSTDPKFGTLKTVKAHNGEVKAVAFKQGTLTVSFSGACTSGCLGENGDTTLTQIGLNSIVLRNIPEVLHCDFISA